MAHDKVLGLLFQLLSVKLLQAKKKIKLGSVTPTRDFNFVTDTCKAFISVGESKDTLGKVINVASNFEISIGDLAELIAEVMNSKIEIETDERRVRPKVSEVNRLFGDNSLLRSMTKWEPDFSGIEGFKDGLKITTDWFLNPKNLNKYKPLEYVI